MTEKQAHSAVWWELYRVLVDNLPRGGKWYGDMADDLLEAMENEDKDPSGPLCDRNGEVVA